MATLQQNTIVSFMNKDGQSKLTYIYYICTKHNAFKIYF